MKKRRITLVKVTSELELQLYEINADSDSWVHAGCHGNLNERGRDTKES